MFCYCDFIVKQGQGDEGGSALVPEQLLWSSGFRFGGSGTQQHSVFSAVFSAGLLPARVRCFCYIYSFPFKVACLAMW